MKTGIKVYDAMTQQPIFVGLDDKIETCAQLMEKKHVATLLVKGKDDIVGIISDQDIVRKIIAKEINPLGQKVKDYMEKKLITIEPDKDIFDAMITMRDSNIRHLPVIDQGHIIGLLTLKDILKIEPQLFELLIDQMNIREEERKPVVSKDEGICELCGEYTEKILSIKGSNVCEDCKDQL